ncbi:hypothetical protein K438DRAFT_2016505 [Mycena galopus ATCC 62051]|nr:hypothetical protein K438DRAFT_2016505 [Mycena galopus ATCC 62051]
MSECTLTFAESSPASIERLPPENLAEIFMLTLPSGRWATYHPTTEKAPWVLAQVCSHWRAVAISTPRLWRTIEIELTQFLPDEMDLDDDTSSAGGASDGIDSNGTSPVGSPTPSEPELPDDTSVTDVLHQQNLIYLVGLFLQRSGTCPLDLKLSWSNRAPCKLHPVVSQVVEMLIGASLRWERLSCELPFSVLVTLPSVKGHVQSLRTLEISDLFGKESTILDVFADAPLLQTVTLFLWRLPPAQSIVTLPWAQLTSYTGSFGHLSDVFATLHETPNLVVCNILYCPLVGIEDNYGTLEKIIPLHFPHLRTLSIDHSDFETSVTGYLAQLVDRLTLPQLEHLKVTCDDEAFPHLTALVARSGCQLQEFSVHGMDFGDAVLAFFASVPSITKLTLGCKFTIAALAWLTRPMPAAPSPLPALQVLNLDGGGELPTAEFAQMIESRRDDARRAGGACLESLRVMDWVLERRIHLMLLSLRHSGLQVEVVDGYDRDLQMLEEVQEPADTEGDGKD